MKSLNDKFFYEKHYEITNFITNIIDKRDFSIVMQEVGLRLDQNAMNYYRILLGFAIYYQTELFLPRLVDHTLPPYKKSNKKTKTKSKKSKKKKALKRNWRLKSSDEPQIYTKINKNQIESNHDFVKKKSNKKKKEFLE